MKTKLVDTITNNEDYVKMRIYDGDLPVDDYYKELLEIEKAQYKSTRFWMQQKIDELHKYISKLEGPGSL